MFIKVWRCSFELDDVYTGNVIRTVSLQMLQNSSCRVKHQARASWISSTSHRIWRATQSRALLHCYDGIKPIGH